jgi:endoglucanase
MKSLPLPLPLLIVCFSPMLLAADMPQVLTSKSPIRIWGDQIGYRPNARKILVVASDAPLPATLNVELRDAKTNESVWKLKDKPDALKPFNGGKKDGESGDFVAHLDLTDFTTPGRYYVAYECGGTWLRSHQFNIASDVYQGAALAVCKAFYYNRADCEKLEKHAGPWNHGPAFLGPNQAKEAKLYKWNGKPHYDPVGTEMIDPTPHDVRGAWWDAGDFNKYTGNTCRCHNELLLAMQLIGTVIKDGDLNIPESGNGVPDLLDEIRYGTEYLIRIADTDGGAFGKVHEYAGSPPESVKNAVQLTAKTSSATMARAATLAYAALVWRELKIDEPFAQKCQDEALRSWKLLQEKPHPWPVDAKDPKKQAYTGDWFSLNYEQQRAFFAACMFSLTSNTDYDKIVKEFAPTIKGFLPGDENDLYELLYVYPRAKGADAATAEQMKKLLMAAADTCVSWTGEKRAYAMGVKGYWRRFRALSAPRQQKTLQ